VNPKRTGSLSSASFRAKARATSAVDVGATEPAIAADVRA